jgi:urease accessory protein
MSVRFSIFPLPFRRKAVNLLGTEDAAINADLKISAPLGAVSQPRARGRMHVSARCRGGRSRLGDLHQSGSFKALFPHGAGQALNAVALNTAGGITGGDRFEFSGHAEADAHLVITTQAAERLYRAQPGEVGRVSNRLRLDAGARLDWLPQETIVFDGAAVERRLEVDLAPDARFLAVEPVIFGRVAMGETDISGYFAETWRIRRDGELVLADNLRLNGPITAQLARPAVADGAGAMASVVLVAPDADLWCARLREIMGATDGISLIRPGVLFARFLAADGFALRQRLIPALQALSGANIPKTWTL